MRTREEIQEEMESNLDALALYDSMLNETDPSRREAIKSMSREINTNIGLCQDIVERCRRELEAMG